MSFTTEQKRSIVEAVRRITAFMQKPGNKELMLAAIRTSNGKMIETVRAMEGSKEALENYKRKVEYETALDYVSK